MSRLVITLFFGGLFGESAEVFILFFMLVIVFRKIQLPIISFKTVMGEQQVL